VSEQAVCELYVNMPVYFWRKPRIWITRTKIFVYLFTILVNFGATDLHIFGVRKSWRTQNRIFLIGAPDSALLDVPCSGAVCGGMD
jgi:hypothetical protein